MNYAYPKFSLRLNNPFCSVAPPGLGNCLFPLARALVYAHLNNTRMISPEWFNLNIGPLLRGTKTRNYSKDFCSVASDISALEKLWALIQHIKVNESELLANVDYGKPRIIRFIGMKDFFKPINQHRAFLRDSIRKRVLSKYLDCTGHLGVHVRLGDFKTASYEELYAGKRNLRTPFSWYKRILKEKLLTNDYREVRYFTDAKIDQIKELVDEFPGEIVHGQSAIADILSLSSCSAIIGSRSTFSLWAYFFSEAEINLPYGKFMEEDELPSGSGINYYR